MATFNLGSAIKVLFGKAQISESAPFVAASKQLRVSGSDTPAAGNIPGYTTKKENAQMEGYKVTKQTPEVKPLTAKDLVAGLDAAVFETTGRVGAVELQKGCDKIVKVLVYAHGKNADGTEFNLGQVTLETSVYDVFSSVCPIVNELDLTSMVAELKDLLIGKRVYARGRIDVNTWIDKASQEPRARLIMHPTAFEWSDLTREESDIFQVKGKGNIGAKDVQINEVAEGVFVAACTVFVNYPSEITGAATRIQLRAKNGQGKQQIARLNDVRPGAFVAFVGYPTAHAYIDEKGLAGMVRLTPRMNVDVIAYSKKQQQAAQ